jgi:hypothetical protein
MRSHDSTEDEASPEQPPSQADPGYKEGGIGQADVGPAPPPVPPPDGGNAQ